MNKSIEYYLGLPYTRELIPDPVGVWFVRIKELPGCMSQGKTPEEAMRMIDDAMRGWLMVSLEDGAQIPEPRTEEDFSGKFVLRLPKSLHRLLAEFAEKEEVSLNAFCSSKLAEVVGQDPKSRLNTGRLAPSPDMGIVFTKLCYLANIEIPEGINGETTFLNWLHMQIDQTIENYKNGSMKKAIKILAVLEYIMLTQGKENTLLSSMGELISQMSELLEVVGQKKEYIEVSQTNLSYSQKVEQTKPTLAPTRSKISGWDEFYPIQETVMRDFYGKSN